MGDSGNLVSQWRWWKMQSAKWFYLQFVGSPTLASPVTRSTNAKTTKGTVTFPNVVSDKTNAFHVPYPAFQGMRELEACSCKSISLTNLKFCYVRLMRQLGNGFIQARNDWESWSRTDQQLATLAKILELCQSVGGVSLEARQRCQDQRGLRLWCSMTTSRATNRMMRTAGGLCRRTDYSSHPL